MSVAGFFIAFAVTAILVPAVGLTARAFGLYAQVSSDRWHKRPVPHFGGVAMGAGLMTSLWIMRVLGPLWPLALSTGLMFAIGLADDIRPIKAVTKLVLQMSAAALFLYFVPPPQITGQPILDLLLAFLWMVGITNAFNLLDNIDGLAGGVAAIVGACVLGVLYLNGERGGPLTIATSALVGLAVGFLLHNFKPASIFMGDSGSLLIGSLVAGVTLLAAPALTAPATPMGVIPVVLLLVPIFDTAFVSFTRRLAGRSAFAGGRDHTSHRLVALGLGERRAVLLLYALTLACGCAAAAFEVLAPGVAWGVLAMLMAALGLVGLYLGHIQATRDGQALAAPPLPSDLTHRYRGYEVALDVVLISSAYYLAFFARFRGADFTHFLPYFTTSLPVVIGTQIVSLWLSGKYRQVWRTLGPSEMLSLFRGSLAGVAASVIVVLYIDRFEGFSRSVFAFDALLASTFMILSRVGLGALDDSLRRRRASQGMALIYGAGRGGALTVRELLQNTEIGLMPLGFIDDDPAKRRLRIEGFPVLGSLDDLDVLLTPSGRGASTVIISILELSREKAERICAICAERGIQVRRFRFALEDVDQRALPPAVVRFKR